MARERLTIFPTGTCTPARTLRDPRRVRMRAKRSRCAPQLESLAPFRTAWSLGLRKPRDVLAYATNHATKSRLSVTSRASINSSYSDLHASPAGPPASPAHSSSYHGRWPARSTRTSHPESFRLPPDLSPHSGLRTCTPTRRVRVRRRLCKHSS